MTPEDAEDDDRRDTNDDDATRSMRSVWLTMREEDPPSGGLAELMAAARSKAAEMKPRESWWQRVVATLRRPPVLALATITLLVGGAVLIGKRQAKLEVERMAPSSVPQMAEDPPPVFDLPTPAAEPSVQEAAPGGGLPALAKDDRRTKPRPRKPDSKPGPQLDPRILPPETTVTADPSGAKLDQLADEESRPRGTGASQIEQPAPEHAGEDRGATTTSAPRPVTVAQLVELSTAAAARGDCATVKTTSERIRKLNPAVYTEQVANNAAIAKCLR
ncbi:MAG: hypothetical protein WKG01_19785 [Kofleriaceae bacterium]